eukprot:1701950-Alexandrium_andersonii.AAC.1
MCPRSPTRSAPSSCATSRSLWPVGSRRGPGTGARTSAPLGRSCRRRRRSSGQRSTVRAVGPRLGRPAR